MCLSYKKYMDGLHALILIQEMLDLGHGKLRETQSVKYFIWKTPVSPEHPLAPSSLILPLLPLGFSLELSTHSWKDKLRFRY
jgi:hypothetical protein